MHRAHRPNERRTPAAGTTPRERGRPRGALVSVGLGEHELLEEYGDHLVRG
ncbi:Hypothetical protein A7982_07643 [Minicystis rosea]|nr:Hypothetical protein A7982_07643 [Minicystis rosea]